MVNRIILLCLLLLCLCVNLVVYGRSGGGSRGSKSGSRSSSSRSSLGRRSGTDADTSSSSSSKHIYQWTSSGISELKSSKSERRLAKYQSQLKNKRKNIPISSGLSEKHSYPSSYGLSGSAPKPALGSAVNSYVPHFNTGSNTALQYVQEYKHSNSRYGDLLIGLTLYNMGRSHRHYHNHFYYDDYYKQRYESFYSDSSKPDSKLSEPAKCTLRIKENEKLEILRIPCEIVSTFTQDSKTVAQDNLVNTTVCVVNSTTVLDTAPFNTSLEISVVSSINTDNTSTETTETPSSVPNNVSSINSTVSPIIDGTYNVTVMNLTKCASTLKEKDPLEEKGPPVNASNMECSVEIQTSTVLLRNNVDCSVLIKYAEMPEPQKDNGILPARDELKSWLTNPPWWLSMFIVV